MSAVFSPPCVPMPADTEFNQFKARFIRDLPGAPQQQRLMQQAPQQPMFDTLENFFQDDDPMTSTEPGVVLKREQESGFLSAWGLLSLDQRDSENLDRFSPEEKKRIEAKCIKEELHCHLKLKMMKEGKEISSEAEDLPARDYPISEETRELQQQRRLKNREAAKKCRQKKKASEREQEQRLHDAQRQIHDLERQLAESQREYIGLLDHFPNMHCFLVYLRQNPHLVRNQSLKPVLQRFVNKHGGAMRAGVAANVNCCSAVKRVEQ